MPTRDINATTATTSKADHVGIVTAMVRLGFDSGDVLAAGTPFDIDYDWDGDTNDETFLGVGNLGEIRRLQESVDVQPYSIELALSGVAAANVSIALGETYQGRDCRVWMVFLDQDSHAIQGAPLLAFRGRLDVMRLRLGEFGRIFVTAHSRLADWARARIRRYTNADQQERWSGDLGLEFTEETSEKELLWGS
jgi:hypothetical protein